VRILHFADLHLDTPFRWAKPEQARKRRRALREAVTRICQLADTHSVDALTCGGDLYEQDRFTPDTAEFLRSTFAAIAPLPVFLAPGNHDWFGPDSLYRRIEWSPNVCVFHTAELTPVTLADGLTLWGAAHCAPAKTPGFLDGFRVDRGGVHIGLFHGSDQGGMPTQPEGKVPHAPFRSEQIRGAGLHHALLGHFHRPVDAPDYTYPGNPEALSFGETWKGTAVLLDFACDGVATRERLVVGTTAVCDITVDLTGVTHENEVLQRVSAALADRSGCVRVTLDGALDAEVDLHVRDIEASCSATLDALVVRLGTVSVARSDDYELVAQEETVRGQFVRDVLSAESLTEEQRQRVLVAGLRALDGRINELVVR
jgi:DNA repair exonuclease SbcCD nuclease subunit